MTVKYTNQIYLGTVLLEKNRWVKGERRPTLAVSDWVRRIADEGFDGIELWQNHALLVGDEERERLRHSPAPVRIFNSYAGCESETLEERKRATEMVRFFATGGVKFNFGRDPARHDEYCENVKAWREMLLPEVRFLCECHGGTTMQDPEQAAATFSRLGREDYEIILQGFGGEDADIRRSFALFGRQITHIHACLSPQGPIPVEDVQKRVDLLASLGFCGSFTVEFTEGVGAENESIESLFRNAVRDLKQLRKCLRRGMNR
jgi:sugar phosphate isomerase/epimerase